MGALIIEDRADVHGIPDQIADMPEMVLTIQVPERLVACCVLCCDIVILGVWLFVV